MPRRLTGKVVLVLAFLFPCMGATVEHAASTLYWLLVLHGLVLGRGEWRKLWRWERQVLIGFTLFFLAIVIALTQTEDTREGWKAVERGLRMPFLIPAYLGLRKTGAELGPHFLWGSVAGLFAACLSSLYDLQILGLERATGAYHPIVFGDITSYLIVISLSGIFTVPVSRWLGVGCGVGLLLASWACLCSGTKAAWLAIPISAVALVWLNRKGLRVKAVAVVGFLISLAVVTIVFLPNVSTHRFMEMLDELDTYRRDPTAFTSTGQRLNMWRDSIAIFRESPVLGTGPGDFAADTRSLIEAGRSSLVKPYSHAHSIYFDALATTGLIGLVSMTVFLLAIPMKIYYTQWRDGAEAWPRFYALGGMMTVLCFAVFGLAEAWLSRMPVLTCFLVGHLVFMSSLGNSIKDAPVSQDSVALTME